MKKDGYWATMVPCYVSMAICDASWEDWQEQLKSTRLMREITGLMPASADRDERMEEIEMVEDLIRSYQGASRTRARIDFDNRPWYRRIFRSRP